MGVGRQAAYCSGNGCNVYGGDDKLKGGSNDSCVLEGKTVGRANLGETRKLCE